MKSRRQFLRNVAVVALASQVSPITALGRHRSSGSTVLSDDCPATTLDLYGEGPFYTDNPPEMMNGILAAVNEPGQRMVISGRVRNLECNEFIPETLIDVWHADDAGAYDNEGFNLRGYTHSNSQGFYTFETVRPGKYLNGSMFRPSHIHFKITPPGFDTFTTQLYFEGDPDLETDAASSVTSGTVRRDASHNSFDREW